MYGEVGYESLHCTQESLSTYECRKIKNLDKEAYDCGYNLDEYMGPFYSSVEDEEDSDLYEEDKSPTGEPK